MSNDIEGGYFKVGMALFKTRLIVSCTGCSCEEIIYEGSTGESRLFAVLTYWTTNHGRHGQVIVKVEVAA